MRRRPTEQPQLKPMDSPKEESPKRKRQGIVPHQNRLSVQDVRDYTTPQGASMANEEMRRLRLSINDITDKLDAGGAAASGGGGKKPEDKKPDDGGGTGAGTRWALSVKHNDTLVGKPKEIQSLNFKDPRVINGTLLPIIFKLKAQELERGLFEGISNGTDSEIAITGNAYMDIKSGILPLNKLPSSIADTPLQIDFWKREGLNYNPSTGRYGWYVYNYIDHGWLLNNVNDFILNIVDLHEVFIRDGLTELELQVVLDYVEANADPDDAEDQRLYIEKYFNELYPATKNFEPQVFYPEIEGKRIYEYDSTGLAIPKDIVILRGIYKPNLYNYFGGVIPIQEQDLVEDGIIRTNIVYYYVLMRK
jgi:hypothetical protein